LIAALDVVVVATTLAFYHQFQAVWFDQEFARLRGLSVEFYYLTILCLIALTVVLLITIVGIVLVIALLTLPAATAGLFTRTIHRNMLGAVLLSIGVTFVGLVISYGPNLPAGATIIVVAGAIYLGSLIINSRRLASY
jgi:zinc transport system permease protein